METVFVDLPLIKGVALTTREEGDAFVDLVKVLSSTRRFCSHLFASPDLEWKCWRAHLKALDPWKNQIPILLTPLEGFFVPAQRRRLVREEESLLLVSQLYSMRAWIILCRWFDEELEEVFRSFLYDALDEYSLAGPLQDFHHETQSALLFEALEHLDLLEREEFSYGRERDYLLTLLDLKRMVQAHNEALGAIVSRIGAIEKNHPVLVPIKETGMVLHALLADALGEAQVDWIKQQWLFERLGKELHFLSAFHSPQGLVRSYLAFLTRLALRRVEATFSKQEMLVAALKWDEMQEGALLRFFRETVLTLMPPLAKLTGSLKPPPEGWQMNPEILKVLPPSMVPEGRDWLKNHIGW